VGEEIVTPEQKSALESAIAHFERNGFWEAAELRGILDDEARRTVSGQEAQPIYQARSINSVTWTDQSKDGYDHMAKYPMCFEVRIVYAAPIPATELTDEQIRRIWLIETGTTEQDSPLAILDFARAILAAGKEKP
jgi:hypothetical protein